MDTKKMMDAIKYYFVAPWPKMLAEARWTTIVTHVLIYAMLLVLLFATIFKTGWTPLQRAWHIGVTVLMILTAHWAFYALFHIGIGAVEGMLIGWYKIKEAKDKGSYPAPAFSDYFIARHHFESEGPLQGSGKQLETYRKQYHVEYINTVKKGLCRYMSQYECIRKALTDEQIEKFASLLVDYRTGENRVVEAVSSEKLDIGPCELLTMFHNMFPEPKKLSLQAMEIAQMVASAFPKNFKYSTANTELSRIRNCTKEGIRSKKPSITEVQVLPPEQLEDSLNYFYELGKGTEGTVK